MLTRICDPSTWLGLRSRVINLITLLKLRQSLFKYQQKAASVAAA